MKIIKRHISFFSKEFLGFIARVLGGVYLLKFLCRKEPLLVVLNYHNFSRYNNYTIRRGNILETGYAENFEEQIKWLKKHFKFLHPEEFFIKNPKNGLNVFITFDDGYKDNFDLAFPVLKKFNAKAAFFIVSGITGTSEWLWHDKLRYLGQNGMLDAEQVEEALLNLNKGKKVELDLVRHLTQIPDYRLFMDWKELNILANNNFIIGSHTHTHSPLKFLSYKDIEKEVSTSLNLLSSKISRSINHFAYPNGLVDKRCSKIMRSYQLKYLFTTNAGINGKNDSTFGIKRLGINASDSTNTILLKLLINFRK